VVKETRRYFDLNNIVIFSFILIIFISFISNSFSENQSKTNLNNSKINQFPNSTQILANSKIKGNFFFLKDNDIFIPINFFSDNKNLIDNIIYEKDKNYLTVILNKPSFNENSLIIQIPRNILDSKTQDNKDKNFTVLINNKPSKYLEINNKSISKINLNSDDGSELIKNALNNTANRIISIKFDKDSKVIKILGTDLSENQRLVPKIQKQLHIIFPIEIENKITYLTLYIEGGYLTDINLRQNSLKNNTLELFLNPFNIDGNLLIQIPRNILDSKTQDNKDKNFTVLINNKPSKYLEINNKSISKINLNSDDGSELIKNALNNTANRIISIKFDKDSKVIKILGTDLSENQRLVPKIQNSINNGFNFINPIIIITVFFIITVTIYLLYKNGKLKFVKTFKFKREGKNKKV
jgi:Holliday junction resolvase